MNDFDMMQMTDSRYERIISLGRHCQTAYQIRRFTGDETAFYFDWVGTPHRGLIQVLGKEFKGSFQRENLLLTEDDTNVVDQSNGLRYRHSFSKIPGQKRIDPNSIAQEFDEEQRKYDFLICRWRSTINTQSVIFVRQDTPSVDEAIELYNVLARQTGSNRIGLLFVIPPKHELFVEHPSIYVERGGMLPSSQADWKGIDWVWEEILSKYWRGERPIRAVQKPSTVREPLPMPPQ
jgi:hypothetical protein